MDIKLDEGFQFGLGAFETIAVEEGRPILLDRHLRRLERAAAFFGFGPGFCAGCHRRSGPQIYRRSE